VTLLADEDLPFDVSKLDRLAEVCIRVGLNLQPGQELLVSGNVQTLPLLRRISAEAYRNGAALVTVMMGDDELGRMRYLHGSDESFDVAPGWLYEAMAKAYGSNTARLAISGEDPMLLSDFEPYKLARVSKAHSMAYKPASKMITTFATNWNIVSYPTTGWARKVFPDLPEREAVSALAEAIFSISRVDADDPIAAWAEHQETLTARQKWLNNMDFDALHYSAPGTDFTLGLAEGHSWKGGSSKSLNGIICTPNIPTEEVFTTPHAERADGIVRATKPLVHNGTIIKGIQVRSQEGRIVEASASQGEEVFLELIDTDEGARRLGEVALVPNSSPISSSGILFFNTLYDENASCHIAQGQCYTKCFKGQIGLDEEKVAAAGGNSSNIHVDWMIGSGELDLDGITKSGENVPIMRNGEWAYE